MSSILISMFIWCILSMEPQNPMYICESYQSQLIFEILVTAIFKFLLEYIVRMVKEKFAFTSLFCWRQACRLRWYLPKLGKGYPTKVEEEAPKPREKKTS